MFFNKLCQNNLEQTNPSNTKDVKSTETQNSYKDTSLNSNHNQDVITIIFSLHILGCLKDIQKPSFDHLQSWFDRFEKHLSTYV